MNSLADVFHSIPPGVCRYAKSGPYLEFWVGPLGSYTCFSFLETLRIGTDKNFFQIKDVGSHAVVSYFGTADDLAELLRLMEFTQQKIPSNVIEAVIARMQDALMEEQKGHLFIEQQIERWASTDELSIGIGLIAKAYAARAGTN